MATETPKDGMKQVPYIRLSTDDEWSYPDQRKEEAARARHMRLVDAERSAARAKTFATNGCTSQEPCCHPDMCEKASICLGSDEGVAYQEACMKAFFNWLLPQYAEKDKP